MTAATNLVPAAFWLLPCAADTRRLQEIIDTLALAHGAPPFEPHVTLHVTACPADVDIEGVLARLADQHAALTLAALATDHSEAYYKALFVNLSCELEDGPGLLALRRELVGQLLDAWRAPAEPMKNGTPAPAGPRADAARELATYAFQPHVSLLYGDLPGQSRAGLASHHDLHGRTLRFDRIAAVRPAPGHRDLTRVAHWEVYGHRRLRD